MSNEIAEVEGLADLLRKLDRPTLLGPPLRNFFDRVTVIAQSRAREYAPVDQGRLRNSLAREVHSEPVPLWGKVGTNLSYARPMEYGTGTLSEAPDTKGRRHWPPSSALDVWARRHGFASGFMVARAIGLRGGLHPRRYMRRALSETRADANRLLAQTAEEIRQQWRK